MDLAAKHYLSDIVRGEVADYCRGRWIAIEGGAMGSRVFLRYWKDGSPLSVNSPQDLLDLLKHFSGIHPRSIYGSVNVYKSLADKSLLEDPSNIAYASPIWDVDCELSEWRGAIEAARIIVSELERLGITRSVFIKWSGEGLHVHVHERCFSSKILSKYNPLDIAYSLVDYVIERCRERILNVISRFKSVKVENTIDPKRVFTAPLSLHRRRNLCCVCFKPNEIDSFEIEWANPEKFKHNRDWRIYVEGEGDGAAIEAIKAVGGYRGWLKGAEGVIRTVISAPTEKTEGEEKESEIELKRGGKIGRFQVMGLLQAARYYLLTGNLERAKSFGLNRAVFYAWAKRRGKGVSSERLVRGGGSVYNRVSLGGAEITYVGNEGAFITRDGWFTIGDEIQRPEDYDRQIAKPINSVISYERAWQAALEYLKGFDRQVLLDQQRFFKEVYEPVRDKFLDLVLNPKKLRRDLTQWL